MSDGEESGQGGLRTRGVSETVEVGAGSCTGGPAGTPGELEARAQVLRGIPVLAHPSLLPSPRNPLPSLRGISMFNCTEKIFYVER